MTNRPRTSTEIIEHAFGFKATDGIELSGKWFVRDKDEGTLKAAVVIVCGGGIPARSYYSFARHLAARSIAVLTFDYRGIGASRRGSLRGVDGGTDVWATRDLAAALDAAEKAYPGLRLGAVTHSVGALLLGAALGAERLASLVFLAPHTGYWGDYARNWRWLLYATWHVLMPAITHVFGYFPGKRLGLGEDLPARFALDWAGRRQPALLRPGETRPIAELLRRYATVHAPTLVISASDDAFAPPAAAKRLLDLYPNIDVTLQVVKPIDAGARKVGHFGFIRRSTGPLFWDAAADWILDGSRASRAVA